MDNSTVVFDLDGTLIDTAPDLVRATNHVITGAGFAPATEAFLRPYISFGTRVMIDEAVKAQGTILTATDLDSLFEQLIAFYGANIAVDSRPFPGLVKVLDNLVGTGTTIAICTNKREDMAKVLMHELGLTDYFKAITGRDTFPVCKPDPEHLFGAIRMAEGDVARAVMVGDSDVDVATAKAARIPVIGVTFGYTSVPVTELECDAVISHYDEFEVALDAVRPWN